MADNSTINPIKTLQDTLNPVPAKKKANDEIGKNDFMQLLVTQLKNQDPMEPMNNDQFAVNLAQFSQLEQLVSINDKVGASSEGSLSNLASYLGNEVTFKSDKVQVNNRDGGIIKMDLGSQLSDVKIDLLNSDDSVKESISVGDLTPGKHTIQLANLATVSGAYKYSISGIGINGMRTEQKGSVAGIVSGYIPGADPSLIVNGLEIKPGDITEVSLAQNS